MRDETVFLNVHIMDTPWTFTVFLNVHIMDTPWTFTVFLNGNFKNTKNKHNIELL